MSPRPSHLDRSRSYASVHGDASYSYEQDGKQFDHQGLEILPEETGEVPARREPKAAVRQQAPSSAAQRMRKTRQRRRAGIIAVVSVEIRQEVLDHLVARNMISRDEIGDRAKISTAIGRILDDWHRI
jgi:ribosomal protein S25